MRVNLKIQGDYKLTFPVSGASAAKANKRNEAKFCIHMQLKVEGNEFQKNLNNDYQPIFLFRFLKSPNLLHCWLLLYFYLPSIVVQLHYFFILRCIVLSLNDLKYKIYFTPDLLQRIILILFAFESLDV